MAGSEPSRRERTARKARLATGATAAGAGSLFGAAKLRDSYKADYPNSYRRGLRRLDAAVGARQTATGQQRAARVVRVATEGHPGFVPLAVASAAGVAAAGVQRYERHLARGRTVGKSAPDVEGEVSRVIKTDTGHGYRPASAMTAEQHRAAARDRRDARSPATTRAPGSRGPSLEDVYRGHGIAPGITAAVHSPTRQSTVHPKVHYGASVSPELEHRLDRTLNPGATGQLRHPVVFHRGKTLPGALAAAAGAHTTTRGRGHVVLNRDAVDPAGRVTGRSRASFRSLVHHELAHAARRNVNPGVPRSPTVNLREEARADATAVPGAGIYRRNKAVPPKRVAHALARVSQEATRNGIDGLEQLGDAQAYHRTHAKVRAAVPHPPGLLRETAFTASRRARRPRNVVLAAAGVAEYAHHRHKPVRKSAFEPLAKGQHRDRAVTAAAGVGSLVTARSAGHDRRAAKDRLLEAAEHERRSNASFHAAAESGRVATQRMVRHVGGNLPRTTANLTRTGVELGRQQAHITSGLAARDAAHAATRSGNRGLRVSRGKLIAAGVLGAAAAVHDRRH